MTAKRLGKPLPILVAMIALFGLGAAVVAQIEGGERGVIPIDTSGSLEVTGVDVDVYAKTADAARLGGWRLAQRKAWAALWTKYNGGSAAPRLNDGTLDSIVGSIVVEQEQIGPTRYIARLGVLFDKARAGQILGLAGGVQRSVPLLLVPVQWSGGRGEVFEFRTDWQRAWARFRTGEGSIDYVRPHGTGPDPLLLNAAQAGRRDRVWWRALLDNYGAADLLIPTVRLERQWPGGPVIGHFTAAFGPDSRIIEQFSLRVANSGAPDKMLDAGVRRIDAAYTRAQFAGALRPDPTLIIEEPVEPEELEALTEEVPLELLGPSDRPPPVGSTTVAIQFDSPSVGAITGAEGSLRGIPGVSSASTTSIAVGGVSIMRVVYSGDPAALSAALAARGWQVEGGGGSLRIRRAAAPSAPPPELPPGNTEDQ